MNFVYNFNSHIIKGGPIFEKIMKRYTIFSVQIINYQIDQKQK